MFAKFQYGLRTSSVKCTERLCTLDHAFLGLGDSSALFKDLINSQEQSNMKESFWSYRWGNYWPQLRNCLYKNRSPVFQVNKMLREPSCVWTFVLLVLAHCFRLEFQIKEAAKSAHAEQLAARTGSSCGHNSSRGAEMGIWVIEGCNMKLHNQSGFSWEMLNDTYLWTHLYFYHHVKRLCNQNIFPINH